MIRLKNTNPLGQVDLPLIGRKLEPGEEFEIDEKWAGEPAQIPDWELAKKNKKYPPGTQYRVLGVDEEGQDVVEVRHVGHGLLAQTGNYEQVKGAKA